VSPFVGVDIFIRGGTFIDASYNTFTTFYEPQFGFTSLNSLTITHVSPPAYVNFFPQDGVDKAVLDFTGSFTSTPGANLLL